MEYAAGISAFIEEKTNKQKSLPAKASDKVKLTIFLSTSCWSRTGREK